ncbi:glycosyltransferase family A protein [Nodularia harveyana UHCC-0300]|uniref:Glycosyltransferase family A protein n=1 Tax=Nodularia harveyana UHCC-0300 TaxID=2974287 RepID=A0ABU5UI30_9CYAN|nr:glycosyltransferase family A protein [Nodularia harveyana]MEA5583196.1 glycosyltransferase family A protein [Nodularia harveyana UHCC-0300]
MNQNPLVSCIIIFLNCEKFIEEAIESIFSQTYPNWELLLVDDGSTDRTTEIALHYAQKYPDQVRYLEHQNHENRGMSASRNLGINNSQGEYIAFLDADDVWLPSKLVEQLAIFQTYPEARMVYGRTQIWYSWTGNPQDSQRDHFMDLGIPPNTLVLPPKLLEIFWTDKNQTPTTCNAIIHHSVFEKVGQFEESFRGQSEDSVFWTKVELNFPIFVADNFWAKYRQHDNSCMNLIYNSNKIFYNLQNYYNWTEKYLSQQEIKDQEIWHSFKKASFIYRHPLLFFFKKGYIGWLMRIGKIFLPKKLRHWLWVNIGTKL